MHLDENLPSKQIGTYQVVGTPCRDVFANERVAIMTRNRPRLGTSQLTADMCLWTNSLDTCKNPTSRLQANACIRAFQASTETSLYLPVPPKPTQILTL